MKYEVIISNSAIDDLLFIKNFIALDNPSKATEYVNTILAKIETLKDFPCLGKPIKKEVLGCDQVPALLCLKHIVFYKVNNDSKTVFILTLYSQYQNWEKILK